MHNLLKLITKFCISTKDCLFCEWSAQVAQDTALLQEAAEGQSPFVLPPVVPWQSPAVTTCTNTGGWWHGERGEGAAGPERDTWAEEP